MNPSGPAPPSSTVRPGPRNPLALFFFLACLISWSLWAPLWLPVLGIRGMPVTSHQHALGALGPIAAAFLVTALVSGRAGVRRLLASMVALKGNLPWTSLALLGPVALLALALGLAAAFGNEPVDFSGVGRSSEFPDLSPVGYFLYHLLTFGFGEETGWRGFALPRLQRRHTAIGATLLLTVGWAVWHIPLFLYRPGYSAMGLAGISGWLFSLVTGSILLTWLFNSARGSVLVVALFHASMDLAFVSDATSPLEMNITGTLITLAGLAVLLVAGARELSSSGPRVTFNQLDVSTASAGDSADSG